MKAILIALVLLSSVGLAARAADVALVYENEAAVREGRAVVGAVTSEGVLISAKLALANNSTLLVGIPQDKLKKAILIRLDNKLDVALVQPGEPIANEELQKSFQEKSSALTAFLPATNSNGSGL